MKKGAAVKKGDLLVSLDCADARASLSEAQERLTAAEEQARAAEASIGAARATQQVAGAARVASEAQAASLSAQRDATLRQASRLDRLTDDVALSSRDQTRASADGLAHQVEALHAQARASLAQVGAAGADLEGVRSASAGRPRDCSCGRGQLGPRRLLVDECEIAAPRDAWVTELPHEEGELVAPGTTLVRLLDLSEVRATFYLPNAELATVKLGAPALAVADAYPDEEFPGRVSTVAFKAEFTPRNIQTRSDRDAWPIRSKSCWPTRQVNCVRACPCRSGCRERSAADGPGARCRAQRRHPGARCRPGGASARASLRRHAERSMVSALPSIAASSLAWSARTARARPPPFARWPD